MTKKILKHRIPASQKDREWMVGMAKQYLNGSLSAFYDNNDLYLEKICAGKADKSFAKIMTNPYGLSDPRYQNYPAQYRNMDFISPLFRKLRTMWTERQTDPVVFTRDSSFESEASEAEMGMINDSLQQRFVNKLIQSGQFDPLMAQQQQQQPPMSPDVIANEKKSIKDAVSIEGQHTLNYVMDDQKLKSLYRKVWGKFTELNKCATFKDVRRDRVIVYQVDTNLLRYKANKNCQYLEDAEAVVARFRMSFTDILEAFQDKFEEDQYKKEYPKALDELEALIIGEASTSTGNAQFGVTDWMTTYRKNRGLEDTGQSIYPDQYNPDVDDSMMGNVDHVQYTSYRKLGKVWDEQTNEVISVTEDYLGDDVISWEWVPEQREMWVIEDKWYLGGDPVEFTPRDPDNPFYTKKSYNGRIFMQGNVQQIKIAEVLAFYQESYDAITFKLQNTINKNKDKLAVLPIGLLGHFKDTTNQGRTSYNGDLDDDGNMRGQYNPSVDTRTGDSSIAKSLYYADTTQFLFVDETSETAQIAAQMIKEIDLGLGNYIQYLMNYRREIREEAEELVGFNRYMQARTTGNDPVTNVSNGQYLSTLVLEEYFTEFEEFLNVEYQGILDRCGYAFKEGMKLKYVRDRNDIEVLNVTGVFAKHVFGAFTRTGLATKNLTDTLKLKVNEMIQNGYPVSVVAKILVGNMNWAETISNIERVEAEMRQQSQAAEQARNETQLQVQQMVNENDQANREVKIYDIDMRALTATLQSNSNIASWAVSSDNQDAFDSANAQNIKLAENINKRQMSFNADKTKVKVAEINADAKKYQADKQEKVARINPG